MLKIIKKLTKVGIFSFLSLVVIIIALYTNAYLSEPIKLSSIGTYSLYDKNEELIYQGSAKSKWVSLDDISDYMIDAVISVEDKNFYNHNGFDYLRIIKAMLTNIKNGHITEGGSTISQQYVKNAYLEFDQTWSRKIKEALMTLNLEVHYEKDEILEAYLNTINYGQGCYGIYDAAHYYFNKEPKDLNLEECLILAGIPKSPSNYNPVSNYDKSIKRAKIVALMMVKNNKLTQDEYNDLFKSDIDIYASYSEKDLKTLMYYQQAVKKELEEISDITEEQIYSGNLKVYTTLDFDLQKAMEDSIENNITDDNIQTAGIAINPKDGSVLALSGGRDYKLSQYNRALYSKRQVGSTMKPFLYYSALANNMTSSSTFLSQETTFNLGDGNTYSPKNYGDVYGNKEITMAAAIAYSDNIYAVKTNLFLGVDELIKTAKLCGIKEELNPVASLALGTSEINLIDYATGYTTLASGGYQRNIHFVTKVEDENGNILYEYEPDYDLVLNPNYVYILNELLTSPVKSAFIDYNVPTGINVASKLSRKYAVKTGTTDTDYWVVGYNPNILMITWAGYDDNSGLPLSTGLEAKNAWVEAVESYMPDDNSWYEMPDNVVGMPLNAVDGLPTSDSNKVNMFYYFKGSEPDYDIATVDNKQK